MIDGASEGFIFYWVTIFFDNLASHILSFQHARSVSEDKLPPFYMSAYIMDALYFSMDFPAMGWKWTIQDPKPLHIYHEISWETKYFDHFYYIFHTVIILIYEIIFGSQPPRMSQEAMDYLTRVGNWFEEELFTYIKVWGNLAHPHVFALFIPNKLICREVAYHIVSCKITKVLREYSKKAWTIFPLKFGIFHYPTFMMLRRKS